MQSKDTCKLSCCYSCTLCNRAIAKERQKRSNKVCERCSLCKSLSFCPCCHKCPQCCQKSTCGRPSAKVLAGLALSGFKSKGSVHTKARVFPALQSTTPLSRSPVIVSGYANPVRNVQLKEALQALIQKQALAKVVVPTSLAFYNRLFLVPKPNNKWRPILDLSHLNLYLAPASFKMETPETIRLSFNKGSGSLCWTSATLTFMFH